MIKAIILNSEASLNNFFELDSIEFVPGENLDVVIQLMHAQRGHRFVAPSTADVKLTFTNKDNTTLVKTASVIDAGDRSMWKVSISQAESTNLAGHNIEVEYDEANDDVKIYKAVIYNGMIRKNLSGDC